MISEQGNKLTTTKFTVWLNKDNSGILKLAAYPGSLPSRLSEVRSFGVGKVQSAMLALRTELQEHESGKRLPQRPPTRIEFFCFSCNLAFTRYQADFKGTAVAHCPECREVLEYVNG